MCTWLVSSSAMKMLGRKDESIVCIFERCDFAFQCPFVLSNAHKHCFCHHSCLDVYPCNAAAFSSSAFASRLSQLFLTPNVLSNLIFLPILFFCFAKVGQVRTRYRADLREQQIQDRRQRQEAMVLEAQARAAKLEALRNSVAPVVEASPERVLQREY